MNGGQDYIFFFDSLVDRLRVIVDIFKVVVQTEHHSEPLFPWRQPETRDTIIEVLLGPANYS